MYLDEKNLKELWLQRESIFKKKDDLTERFNEIASLVSKIVDAGCKVTIGQDGKVTIGTHELVISDDKTLSTGIFGPAKDEMVEGVGFKGVLKQAKAFTCSKGQEEDAGKCCGSEELQGLIKKIGCLLGGFEFSEPHDMRDCYRIISNTITKKDDFGGTLGSSGIARHPSSNFADNTYFFNIMKLLQELSKNGQPPDTAAIALRYPITKDGSKGYCSGLNIENDDWSKEANSQQTILNCRFPLKFLWMWANKGKVLHPFSLMAFRNFVDSDFGKEILKKVGNNSTPAGITNMGLNQFKTQWVSISEKVLQVINGKDSSSPTEESLSPKANNNISDLSKLISVIMVEDTDMKNIEELLEVSKQIILYGPPGTGKTYSAMDVVEKFIKPGTASAAPAAALPPKGNTLSEDEYRFIKKFPEVGKTPASSPTVSLDHGFYEIIQFHPSYTYQDFIGGIAPALNNTQNNTQVKYELREGIFKRFCDTAKQNANYRFVFIIDEINRANLSEVFGELPSVSI